MHSLLCGFLSLEPIGSKKGANMSFPLMPKATAVWLIDNTALSFDQIADFCGLHALEVKGLRGSFEKFLELGHSGAVHQ